MPNRATALLLVFFVLALACFGLALFALQRRADLLSLLLFGTGALALRALSRAASIAEGSAR